MNRYRKGQCIHFNGIQSKVCEAGVRYEFTRSLNDGGLPCLPKCGRCSCARLQHPTEEQVKQSESEMLFKLDKVAKGISPCCEASLDTSQVIQTGRHKGHGPRFCSKCGKFVMIV